MTPSHMIKQRLLTHTLRLAAAAVVLTLLTACFDHMRRDQGRRDGSGDGPDGPAPREMNHRR